LREKEKEPCTLKKKAGDGNPSPTKYKANKSKRNTFHERT
jgi:hypothetical protein